MTEEKRITTHTVLSAIRSYDGQKDAEGRTVFSTLDIAGVMGCEEYPVRVACSWLRRYRLIEAIEGTACIRRARCQRRPGGEFYTVNLYRLRPQSQGDLDALYRAFGLAGVK